MTSLLWSGVAISFCLRLPQRLRSQAKRGLGEARLGLGLKEGREVGSDKQAENSRLLIRREWEPRTRNPDVYHCGSFFSYGIWNPVLRTFFLPFFLQQTTNSLYTNEILNQGWATDKPIEIKSTAEGMMCCLPHSNSLFFSPLFFLYL